MSSKNKNDIDNNVEKKIDNIISLNKGEVGEILTIKILFRLGVPFFSEKGVI